MGRPNAQSISLPPLAGATQSPTLPTPLPVCQGRVTGNQGFPADTKGDDFGKTKSAQGTRGGEGGYTQRTAAGKATLCFAKRCVLGLMDLQCTGGGEHRSNTLWMDRGKGPGDKICTLGGVQRERWGEGRWYRRSTPAHMGQGTAGVYGTGAAGRQCRRGLGWCWAAQLTASAAAGPAQRAPAPAQLPRRRCRKAPRWRPGSGSCCTGRAGAGSLRQGDGGRQGEGQV